MTEPAPQPAFDIDIVPEDEREEVLLLDRQIRELGARVLELTPPHGETVSWDAAWQWSDTDDGRIDRAYGETATDAILAVIATVA